MQTTPSREYFGAFSDVFKQQVHRLIALGYQDALPKIKTSTAQDHDETAITGYIVSALRNRKRDLRRTPSWIKHYSFHDDPPLDDETKSGRRRKRADIIIEWDDKRSPEFVFEAKRLRKNGYRVDKYVGLEGMGCFLSGDYANRYDEAAMLGYVQSDSLNFWKQKVWNKIETEANSLELLQQINVNISPDFPDEWLSEHNRKKVGRKIKIYHILLDCIV